MTAAFSGKDTMDYLNQVTRASSGTDGRQAPQGAAHSNNPFANTMSEIPRPDIIEENFHDYGSAPPQIEEQFPEDVNVLPGEPDIDLRAEVEHVLRNKQNFPLYTDPYWKDPHVREVLKKYGLPYP